MNESATISLDLKKYRIRIHKAMLHKLGNPNYIQLLVNPQSRVVVIRCIDTPLSGEPFHKVSSKRLSSDNSYEIYSMLFLKKLIELVPAIETRGLYRLDGEIISCERAAVFNLQTLRLIDT